MFDQENWYIVLNRVNIHCDYFFNCQSNLPPFKESSKSLFKKRSPSLFLQARCRIQKMSRSLLFLCKIINLILWTYSNLLQEQCIKPTSSVSVPLLERRQSGLLPPTNTELYTMYSLEFVAEYLDNKIKLLHGVKNIRDQFKRMESIVFIHIPRHKTEYVHYTVWVLNKPKSQWIGSWQLWMVD